MARALSDPWTAPDPATRESPAVSPRFGMGSKKPCRSGHSRYNQRVGKRFIKLANQICQPANGENVPRLVQCDTIVEAETLISHHLVGNRLQAGVISLEAVTLWSKL